jgi:hypothetical protein
MLQILQKKNNYMKLHEFATAPAGTNNGLILYYLDFYFMTKEY